MCLILKNIVLKMLSLIKTIVKQKKDIKKYKYDKCLKFFKLTDSNNTLKNSDDSDSSEEMHLQCDCCLLSFYIECKTKMNYDCKLSELKFKLMNLC